MSGGRPVTEWRPDEVLAETYRIPLDLPPADGHAIIQLALVDTATGKRLNLIHEDGRWIDDVLRLSAVRVGN